MNEPDADERLRAAYDTIAADYAAAREPEYWGAEAAAFEELLPGRRVIDLGCGAGRDAAMFRRHGLDYLGVDLSDGMLAAARTRVPQADLRQMDFRRLAFADAAFDGFWAAASFLHVPRAEFPALLAEAARVIRPGGAGFVTVKERRPGTEDGWITDKRWSRPVDRYFAFYDEREIHAFAADAGLETVEVRRREDTAWISFFLRKWA